MANAVTLAVLKNEICHIKEKQLEQSSDIKSVLKILTAGEGKIASLRECNAETVAYRKVDNKRIGRLEKVALSVVSALLIAGLGLAVSYIF